MSSPCSSVLVVAVRVDSALVEISNSVYWVGSARSTRLAKMTAASTSAESNTEANPWRSALVLPCFNLHFFILQHPLCQFQRRRSSVCPVKNRNTPMTER